MVRRNPSESTQQGDCVASWVPYMDPSRVLSFSYPQFFSPPQPDLWHFGSRVSAFWPGAYGRSVPNKYFIELSIQGIHFQPWCNLPGHHGFSSFDDLLVCVSVLFLIYQWLELSDRCGLWTLQSSHIPPMWAGEIGEIAALGHIRQKLLSSA